MTFKFFARLALSLLLRGQALEFLLERFRIGRLARLIEFASSYELMSGDEMR